MLLVGTGEREQLQQFSVPFTSQTLSQFTVVQSANDADLGALEYLICDMKNGKFQSQDSLIYDHQCETFTCICHKYDKLKSIW